ncbi:hypothetical protein KM924_23395 [Brevibacillus parabrevis]|uniref:hypothetical protein n=1 Tax=Brevibacillus parabrevis TaxID=54914 RepID=UPI001C2482C7|nr:hypothetical protein [Brevibacillus parabrevis]MBU8715449.1 hypothetical protein [Brevibacillus parabrevis]
MTTKPNASPPIICGRPYVLFDPEQTAEIKRIEAKNDAIERVVNGLNASLVALSEYDAEYGVDPELVNTVREATDKLRHLSGIEFDTYLDANCSNEDLRRVKWNGEVETIC